MNIKELTLGTITLPSNVLMAPLAGYTCYPFRMMCTELGAGLCFMEMVSSNSLNYKDKATQRIIFTTPEERIKALQLFGNDPRIVETIACSEFMSGFDIIDINMGCPVPQIFKSGSGSALMGDLRRASQLIRACKKSGKPVTVKTRVGLNEQHLIAAEFARMCEDSGADMITIHGRSRSMMYSGEPYFDQIEQAKSVVNIPVIANGGLNSVKDIERMMNLTGADGVMIGRYALENPFIFSELTHKKITKDKYKLLQEQIALTSKYYDETFTLSYIKKITGFMMRGISGSKPLKQELYRCGNISEIKEVMNRIFKGEMQ
ncbi:MAG: tRNA-dihydrouridine synthase family protein [Tannerella sp.]|nr:tRNA-dihydrouridine synthase family protein [Tannerella sp.]